jgi:hypothetical protein
MDYALFDLYSDYLLSSFAATTATGLARLMNAHLSHDQVSRMLNSEQRAQRLVADDRSRHCVLCNGKMA